MSFDAPIPTHADSEYTVLCGWCRSVLSQGPRDSEISHGICPPCMEKFFGEELNPETDFEPRRSRRHEGK